MENSVFDSVSSAALSLTASGTTGISPFLTLFLLGLIEKTMPDLLPMGGPLETILANWWSLIVLGLLAALEIFSKCVPALDEIIDSFEVFLVPLLSVVATMATLGIVSPNNSLDGSADPDEITTVGGVNEDIQFWTTLRIVATVGLVMTGMVLSLLMHFLKMIVRVSSLMCAGGLCQPCITLLEVVVVSAWIISAIFSPVFAIVACLILFAGAAYVLRVKCCSRKTDTDVTPVASDHGSGGSPNDRTVPAPTTATGSMDTELGGAVAAPPIVEATAVLVYDPSAEGATDIAPATKTIGGPNQPTVSKTDGPKLEANLYG